MMLCFLGSNNSHNKRKTTVLEKMTNYQPHLINIETPARFPNAYSKVFGSILHPNFHSAIKLIKNYTPVIPHIFKCIIPNLVLDPLCTVVVVFHISGDLLQVQWK